MKKIVLLALLCSLIGTTAMAQTKAEKRKTQKTEQLALQSQQLEQMVLQEHKFTFVAEIAYSQMPGLNSRQLASKEYFMAIGADKISCALPFYGRSYTSNSLNRISPLSFESKSFIYKSFIYQVKQNDGKYLVQIKAKATVDYELTPIDYNISIEVFDNGTAVVNINSSKYSNMMFFGHIVPFSDEI
ncbi:MAG: DUF4251 domain-containing protein [Mucinivorans sp.]